MTIWIPRLENRTGPRYLRIAGALRDDIASGQLAPGTRLPTHRDLADALGVTVGTVSRAYAEAARMNLISGEIGRGTYVRGESRREEFFHTPQERAQATINLAQTHPVIDVAQFDLERSLAKLARHPDMERFLDYQPNPGLYAHRNTAAQWMARSGLQADAERMVITSGAQNAITVVLSSITQPGDTVLTECLTYPGLKGIAKVLHLNLVPVAMDDEGLLPDSLEAAAVARGARVLYTVPTLHNPTTTIMPASRRREIADVARRLDLAILDDDVNAPLVPDAEAPLASYAPERSYCISAMSKFLSPGLRVGFVLAPEGRAARVAASVRAFTMLTSPLLAELACQWLEDGTADRILAQQQEESRTRQRVSAELLQGFEITAQPYGYHFWLHLPDPWQTEDLEAQARERGVLVTPASAFTVGRTSPPHAVRVGIGGARSQFEEGLGIVAEILRRPPGPVFSIV